MKSLYTPEDLGKEIRSRRKMLGYTQAYLAEYVGVSTSFLSDLENGKETVQLNKLLDVISLLGMDLCLIRREEGK